MPFNCDLRTQRLHCTILRCGNVHVCYLCARRSRFFSLVFICFWFRNGIGLTSAVQPTENNVWSVSKARADGVAHDSLLIPGCTLLSRNRELTRGSLFKTRNCLLGCASQVPMLVGGRVGGISLGKLNGPIPLLYILLMFS